METRAKVLHWFIRGGTLTTPNGATFTIGVEPIASRMFALAPVTP